MGNPPTAAGLPEDDQPFHHYSARHRAVAWISQTLFDGVTYTVRHGLLEGMKRRGGLGWVPGSLSRGIATKEETFWRGLNFKDKIVYDVGAFQGLLTLYFARTAARVISYEPNSRNHARLLENLRVNGLENVTVRKLGLGAEPQTGTLVFEPLMSGGGSLEPKTAEQLRKSSAPTLTEQIEISTIDQEIARAGLPVPDFIKIDIEGWELEALKGARATLAAHRPALFLEMHGETMNEKRRKVAEIVSFLDAAGYRDILHVETGQAIGPSNATLAAEGHLYCPPA